MSFTKKQLLSSYFVRFLKKTSSFFLRKGRFFFYKFKNKKTRNEVKTNCYDYNMLIVIDTLVSDDKGKIIANFANFLIESNVNVIILCNFVKIRLQLDEKIKVLSLNKFIPPKCRFSPIVNIVIFFICKMNNIDIINICDERYIKNISFFKKKIKTVVMCWIFSILDISTRYKYNCCKQIEKSDLIFTMSPEINDFLLNINFNYKKLIIVNNSTKPDSNQDFIAKADSNNAEKEFIKKIGLDGRIKELMKNIGIADFSKKIFYCKCDYHRTDYCIALLKAIKDLKNKDDFIFIFSGTFLHTFKSRLKILDVIKKLNILEFVKIIDCVDDEIAILNLSYAVICMYYNDGAFIKIASETGLAKKPSLIISHNAFIPNVIDGQTGLFVTYDNVNDIKSAINELINLSEEKYNEMCENAYKYTTNFFSKNPFSEMNNNILTFIKKS